MALADIIALAQRQQEELLTFEEELQAQLRDYYRSVAERLDQDIERLTSKIAAAKAGGEQVSESWLYGVGRMRSLQAQVTQELEGFGDYVEGRVSAMQDAAVSLGEEYTHDLLRLGAGPGLRTDLAGLPQRAVHSLVGRTLNDGEPLQKALAKYPEEAAGRIKHELVVGVAVGYAPKKIARKLAEVIGGASSDYLTLARTEVLNAHRAAALATYAENDDLIEGWRWLLGKSDACPLCVGKVGRVYELRTPFHTHPRCRCSPIPVLKEQ